MVCTYGGCHCRHCVHHDELLFCDVAPHVLLSSCVFLIWCVFRNLPSIGLAVSIMKFCRFSVALVRAGAAHLLSTVIFTFTVVAAGNAISASSSCLATVPSPTCTRVAGRRTPPLVCTCALLKSCTSLCPSPSQSSEVLLWLLGLPLPVVDLTLRPILCLQFLRARRCYPCGSISLRLVSRCGCCWWCSWPRHFDCGQSACGVQPAACQSSEPARLGRSC